MHTFKINLFSLKRGALGAYTEKILGLITSIKNAEKALFVNYARLNVGNQRLV